MVSMKTMNKFHSIFSPIFLEMVVHQLLQHERCIRNIKRKKNLKLCSIPFSFRCDHDSLDCYTIWFTNYKRTILCKSTLNAGVTKYVKINISSSGLHEEWSLTQMYERMVFPHVQNIIKERRKLNIFLHIVSMMENIGRAIVCFKFLTYVYCIWSKHFRCQLKTLNEHETIPKVSKIVTYTIYLYTYTLYRTYLISCIFG